VISFVAHPLEQSRAVLHRFNEFIATAPDELTIRSGFLQTPDGATVLFLAPIYCGVTQVSKRSHLPPVPGDLLLIRYNPYNDLIHGSDVLTQQVATTSNLITGWFPD